MDDEVIERVSGAGSAYTVLAKRIDPNEHDGMEQTGFTSPFTQFVVWSSGGNCWTDHDRHRLVRQMTGQNDWLHDHLKRLDEQVRASDDADGGDQDDRLDAVLMNLARYYHTEHRHAQDSERLAETNGGAAIHAARGAAYADAAEAARDTAQYVRGDRDDRPTALVVGEATKADGGDDGN